MSAEFGEGKEQAYKPDERSIRAGGALSRMAALMAFLRSECPWDKKQTLESLKKYLLEETYELLEVMDGEPAHHREELGDVLFQIFFQTEIRYEQGSFELEEVVDELIAKLVRRHLYLFKNAEQARSFLNEKHQPDVNAMFEKAEAHGQSLSLEQIAEHWDSVKEQEKPQRNSVLDGIPKNMPALARAEKIGKRASKQGFDWPDVKGVIAKLHEEISEFEQALSEADDAAIKHELGDLLFSVVNLARFCGVDAEQALLYANRRFENRFRYVESSFVVQGRSMREADLDEMNARWDKAKQELE